MLINILFQDAAKIIIATKKTRSPHKVAGGRTVIALRGDLKANSRAINKSVQAIVKNARRKYCCCVGEEHCVVAC